MEERVFKRKIYNQMLLWKQENQGRTALLVEGARRIGKSTIVETFAKNEYKSYILIDFNKVSDKVKNLFDDLEDLEYIFLYLQTHYHVTLTERQSLIVFDEVQKCPQARQAIKYLVADGRYDYIETGSLISIRKNIQDITIPSEEDRIRMYPMDYEEFRWALGDEVTFPTLKVFYDKRRSLGSLHQLKQRELRLYMLVGGMPQAVNAYLETNNFASVDKVKRGILNLYFDDFNKIDPTGKASMLFRAAPAQLMKNASRYQVSSVLENDRAESVSEIVSEMKESMTVNVAYHSNDPNVGMLLSKDINYYKLYVGDTGLFITLAFWDKDFVDNIIYQKLLGDDLSANLGYVYENLVAQMLRAAGNELYYYTFPTEKGNHSYEIDFLLSRGNKLCPIEVKSSGYNTHASLDAFCEKYSSRIRERYLVYNKDLKKDGETLCLPPYMISFL